MTLQQRVNLIYLWLFVPTGPSPNAPPFQATPLQSSSLRSEPAIRPTVTDQRQFAVAVEATRQGIQSASLRVYEAFQSIPREQTPKADFKNGFDCMSNSEFKAADGRVLAQWSPLPKGQGRCDVFFRTVDQLPVFTVVVSANTPTEEYVSVNGLPMDARELEIAKGQRQVRDYGSVVYAAIFVSNVSDDVVTPADCLSSQEAKDVLGVTIARWQVPPPSVERCRIERSSTNQLRVIVEGSQDVRGGIFFFGN